MTTDVPLLTYEKPVPTEDERHLQSYEGKLTLIRDYVRGVVLRFATGFFLCGNGGISKSHTVLNEMEKLGADYKLFNSRMSGRGLFQSLAEYPARPTSSKTWSGSLPTRMHRGCCGVPCGRSGARMEN